MKIFVFAFFFLLFLFPFQHVKALEETHQTLIINQVRGEECCDAGTLSNLQMQVDYLQELNLPASFAIRYDALKEEGYSQILMNELLEVGGLLEITPLLASAAGVEYKGSADNWYEAQNVFLIGYSKSDRQKLIDAFMNQFYQVYGYYPQFTSSWMIDAWSLQYLKQKYGVQLHQITREQFGTDSYTLYGGPVHYPYQPSANWAMIPDHANTSMPVIVRQTIMDPVYNYGDVSDSYTSQPNDYLLRDADLSYFKHLFQQAHNQPQGYTFALIGLENSMEPMVQEEFYNQLRIVKDWSTLSTSNQVANTIQVVSATRSSPEFFQIYAGEAHSNKAEQAIWIQSDKYRLRLRLSNGELFISDVRIFDPAFEDPYLTEPAGILGWWIVPFVIDGSRNFDVESSEKTLQVRNDYLKDRKEKYGSPHRVTLAKNINSDSLQVINDGDQVQILLDENLVASFTDSSFELAEENAMNELVNNSEEFSDWWGFEKDQNKLWPAAFEINLQAVRRQMIDQLFPQLENDFADDQNSELYVNNRYAIVGRNPVRLVLFPKDSAGRQIMLSELPQVTTQPEISSIVVKRPHGSNGMIFIDLESETPQVITAQVSSGYFADTAKIYFVKDCKQNPTYCLTHPINSWRYLMTKLDDRLREIEEQQQKTDQFVD